jgi:hypothetical protein
VLAADPDAAKAALSGLTYDAAWYLTGPTPVYQHRLVMTQTPLAALQRTVSDSGSGMGAAGRCEVR